jgi:hypothetical protein
MKMGQSNSEFLKMVQSLTALTQATGSMPGLNLSDILTDTENKKDDAPKYDSKKCPVKLKDVEFMRKYVEGGKLKITETNAEYLLEQNPNIFQGIDLDLIDENDDDYFEES